jgi:hypothetical protein
VEPELTPVGGSWYYKKKVVRDQYGQWDYKEKAA